MFAIACGTLVSTPVIVLGLSSTTRCTARSAQRAAVRTGALEHPHAALAAAWPHIRAWWLLAAPLCFALALGIAIMRRRSVEELRERDERRGDRARAKAERSPSPRSRRGSVAAT